MTRKIGITDTILRDAHQSLMATRMRIEDMLPVLDQLDEAGFASLECWGGATFDACIRFLDEDPWDRLRTLKKHLKKTPLQMLGSLSNSVDEEPIKSAFSFLNDIFISTSKARSFDSAKTYISVLGSPFEQVGFPDFLIM